MGISNWSQCDQHIGVKWIKIVFSETILEAHNCVHKNLESKV